MKKLLILLCGIVIWWVLSGILSVPIVNLFAKYNFYSNRYAMSSAFSYSIAIIAPFMISNSLGALVSGFLMSLFTGHKKYWHTGLVFLILSSIFIVITNYKDYLSLLFSKLLIAGIFIYWFAFFGAFIGVNVGKRIAKLEQ